MYLYIFGFFTLGMLGVWLLVVLYTMMVKPKEGDSSGTFKKVLKRSGVLVLVYVVTMVVGTMVFSSMYEKECTPNEEDVKVMKPMAETISNYIVKHGIPKSLEDIPDLPYELECEEVEEEYLAMNYINMVPVKKNKAQLYNKKEKCHFENIELSYWLQNDLTDGAISASIDMHSSNKTIYSTGLYIGKDGKFKKDKVDIGSSKTDGICNPMRQ